MNKKVSLDVCVFCGGSGMTAAGYCSCPSGEALGRTDPWYRRGQRNEGADPLDEEWGGTRDDV
jgi:hypothetical protein